MSEDLFSYLVDMRNKGTPALMEATFMIAILFKQASEDASIRPYYTALRYLYIYVWAIVVVRSVLILFCLLSFFFFFFSSSVAANFCRLHLCAGESLAGVFGF